MVRHQVRVKQRGGTDHTLISNHSDRKAGALRGTGHKRHQRTCKEKAVPNGLLAHMQSLARRYFDFRRKRPELCGSLREHEVVGQIAQRFSLAKAGNKSSDILLDAACCIDN